MDGKLQILNPKKASEDKLKGGKLELVLKAFDPSPKPALSSEHNPEPDPRPLQSCCEA